MIEIKKLTACTLEESVRAWNAGFEGYSFDATTNATSFVQRMVFEDLSPEWSIVAFLDGQPAGIVLQGIREFQGKKLAWNGGTGVAASVRGKGVGQRLIEESLAILQEEGVQLASLEAISDNLKAISLYEKMGYRVIDQLEHLSLKGSINTIEEKVSQAFEESESYIVEHVLPLQVTSVPFYKGMNPWQTQWQSAKEGEGIIVKDKEGNELGYAYYRRRFNTEGEHVSTTLFQCEAREGHSEAESIIFFLLKQVFGSFKDEINRVVPNLPLTQSNITHSVLKKIGFSPVAQQVYMIKELTSSQQ